MKQTERTELIADFEKITGCKTNISRISEDPLDIRVRITVELDTETQRNGKGPKYPDVILAETEKNTNAIRLLTSKGFYPNSRRVEVEETGFGEDWDEVYNRTDGLYKTYDSPSELLNDINLILSYGTAAGPRLR